MRSPLPTASGQASSRRTAAGMEGNAVVTSQTRPPGLEELVNRAESLLPRLRERAAQTEALRRVPAETIAAFRDAGLMRVFQPTRYGGYELDYGRTQIALGAVLGRACGSSAWVQSVVACHAWLAGMYTEEAQDAIWGDDPDALVGSAFSASTGRGRTVDGGYFVEGAWQFSSGCHACQWVVLGVPLDGRPPGPQHQLWCLVGPGDWEIVDVWHAPGLKGTGSNDILVKGAFVPAAFALERNELDGRPTPGSTVNSSYIYRLPIAGFFPYNVSAPAIGIARGALEAYVAQTVGRPDRANSVPRQLGIAEAAVQIDAAEALVLADCAAIERIGHAGEEFPPALRARLSRDTSYMVRQCIDAVQRLASTLGAHGMADDHPVHRAFRDVLAIGNHIANQWDLHALPYARAALGQPPY
jgi:3-hydroxy-9,10-secoandrosta-1,3,5(10)-triene-9,17-dione monooxygenase